jgi:uracil-DNA glycosylase family protein
VARHETPGARWWVPDRLTPGLLRQGIEQCKGCELHEDATHGVAGRGPRDAPLMVVGEQPGDKEDKSGKPFVGPAGKLLDSALAEAGIDPGTVFRTNVVKHFRWRPGARGNRLHKGPTRTHIAACGPWLVAEVDMVKPQGIVLLGASAGKAIYGSGFRVGESRGQQLEWPEAVAGTPAHHEPSWAVATLHPAAVLRSRQHEDDLAGLVADLRLVAKLLKTTS